MKKDISQRIITLENLTGEFFELPKGHLIEKPEGILRIVDIKEDCRDGNHPHKKSRVYITRRAFKHFIESRKEELLKHHKDAEALLNIYFVVEQIPEVILNFDKYEYEIYESEPEKFFYTKHYSGGPSIRILLKCPEENILEIYSIHFTKRKKDQ